MHNELTITSIHSKNLAHMIGNYYMNFIYSVTKTNHLFLLSWLVQMLRCAHIIIIKQVLPKHFLYLFDMFSTRWPLPALSFFCSTVTTAYFMSAHFSNSWFNQPDNNNCKKSLLQNKYVKGGANKKLHLSNNIQIYDFYGLEI